MYHIHKDKIYPYIGLLPYAKDFMVTIQTCQSMIVTITVWCMNIKWIIDLFSGIMSLLVLLVLQFNSQCFRRLSAGHLYSCLQHTHTLLKNMLECGMRSSSLSLIPCQITESFSAAFSPACLPESAVATQASLVCLTRLMRSIQISQPWFLQSSCTLLSPKTMPTESRPFLLANDALIVQVNNLLFFFPWITMCLVYGAWESCWHSEDLKLVVFYGLLHACLDVPMPASLLAMYYPRYPCCSAS